MREWTRLELMPPQRDRRGTARWNRASIRSILLNPRIAGLSVYHGEIVGQGQWEPLVSEETWRAVRGILEDPSRKPPRRGADAAGGLALCPCGNVVAGGPSHTGHRIYRCSMPTRDRSWPGTMWPGRPSRSRTSSTRLVVGGCPAPMPPTCWPFLRVAGCGGAAGGGGGDPPNLEEMAADRALGLITRPQLLAATGRANIRLDEIGTELEHAARENVLAPLVAAENAAELWERLDLQPQAGGHQDPDGGHAAFAGPGRAPPVRPGHGHGQLAAREEG